jgi:hypothetical protein
MTGLPRVHRLWLIPGLALALAASSASDDGVGLIVVIMFGVLPHLPVLLGIRQPRPRGHIGPRAVPLFNALHQPLIPAIAVGLAVAGLLPSLWLAAGLAWLGHIVLDWGLGAGLRAPDGGPTAGGRGPLAGAPPSPAITGARPAGGVDRGSRIAEGWPMMRRP